MKLYFVTARNFVPLKKRMSHPQVSLQVSTHFILVKQVHPFIKERVVNFIAVDNCPKVAVKWLPIEEDYFGTLIYVHLSLHAAKVILKSSSSKSRCAAGAPHREPSPKPGALPVRRTGKDWSASRCASAPASAPITLKKLRAVFIASRKISKLFYNIDCI